MLFSEVETYINNIYHDRQSLAQSNYNKRLYKALEAPYFAKLFSARSEFITKKATLELAEKDTTLVKKELAKKRKGAEKEKKRIEEIDSIILKLYEDKALGNITEERYINMSSKLEAEQKELTEAVNNLEQELNTQKEKIDNVHIFAEKVRQLTTPTELTPELVHEFIEKILVHKPEKINGKRYQEVEIHYNGVGIIRLSADALEEAYQKGNFMNFELIKEEI